MSRAYYEAHREEAIARATAWNKAHPERARATARRCYQKNKAAQYEKLVTWRAANPEKVAAQRRRSAPTHRLNHLLRKFNLTTEQYEAMLAKQGGVCAICATAEKRKDRMGKVKPLAVDHCHGKGVVRGLLCDDCNNGIGRFRDDPALLRNAITYLGVAP